MAKDKNEVFWFEVNLRGHVIAKTSKEAVSRIDKVIKEAAKQQVHIILKINK